MHPAILEVTAYTLLLSSFITLVILLQKRCKHKLKSSFYILSSSDILSTVLTAALLFVNRIEAVIKLHYNWQDNTNDTFNHTRTVNGKHIYQLLFSQIHNPRKADKADFNVTLACDIKDIFTQYGMLLIPLTNAFISLLTFSIQCNFNVACIKQAYAQTIKLPASTTRAKGKNAACRVREVLQVDQDVAFQQCNNIITNETRNVIQKTMKNSDFQTFKKDDRKLSCFLVISQWFVSFFVVGILCFAKYDNNVYIIRHTEDIECIFGINFPMNDYYLFSHIGDNLHIVNSSIHTLSLENDHVVNKVSLNKSTSSNTEIDQIISKVQNIVRTALNYTRDYTESMGITSSGMQNVTKYIKTMSYFVDNSIDTNILTQRMNNKLTEKNTSIHNLFLSIYNNTYRQNPEVTLPYNLRNYNTSEGLDITTFESLNNSMQISIRDNDNGYQEDVTQQYFSSTEESKAYRTIDIPIVQSTTSISNNEIRANVIKVASAYYPRDRYNQSVNQYDRKQPKQNNLKNYVLDVSNLIKDLFLNKNIYLNEDINMEAKDNFPHMINECLISNKFLRLHLFILFFAIYILPILFSCVIQVQGKYTCRNILTMLHAKADFLSTSLHGNIDSNEDSNMDIVNRLRPKQLFTNHKKIPCKKSIEELGISQEIIGGHGSTMDMERIIRSYKSNMEIQDIDMLLEIDCIIRIFKTIKLSLVICIAVWTPIFLETLLRVFLCIRVSRWLIDITFLSAISFGIIRNILNLYIIKVQELCKNGNAKKNSIQPTKLDMFSSDII